MDEIEIGIVRWRHSSLKLTLLNNDVFEKHNIDGVFILSQDDI